MYEMVKLPSELPEGIVVTDGGSIGITYDEGEPTEYTAYCPVYWDEATKAFTAVVCSEVREDFREVYGV